MGICGERCSDENLDATSCDGDRDGGIDGTEVRMSLRTRYPEFTSAHTLVFRDEVDLSSELFEFSDFRSGPKAVGLAVRDRPGTYLDLGLEREGDLNFGDEDGDDNDADTSTLKVSA